MKNNFKASATLFAVLAFNSLPGHSADITNDPDYYRIKDETISFTAEVDSGLPAVPEKMPVQASLANMNKNPMAAGALVNAGSTMWNVINNGAPSGGYASAYASAIPGFSFNWGKITGWKGPKTFIYSYKVRNLIGENGTEVISVKYRISFFYGGTEGSDKDSGGRGMDANTYSTIASGSPQTKSTAAPAATTAEEAVNGAYITNFTVQPIEVSIGWGWNFDLTVKMSDPMNIGSKTRPVAYLQSDLNWIISTALFTKGGTWTYGVDGNGNFKDITIKVPGVNTDVAAPRQLPSPDEIKWN
ncbi:MAG: hypothetical protein WCW52_12070 [Elusimicrobiales bacterium]|jgi:hypothetical protein